MPLNLIIVNFGNLAFKILQSNLSITLPSFFFIYSFMAIMCFSLLSSSFITFCFPVFLEQLKVFSIPSIYMSHFTIATIYLFPHFSAVLKLSSLFSSLTLIFSSLALISPKLFSINCCCYSDLFSLPLNKILLFSFDFHSNPIFSIFADAVIHSNETVLMSC